jgi:hypothetical protein
VLAEAEQRAKQLVDAAGGSTIELPMRCQCWRMVRD